MKSVPGMEWLESAFRAGSSTLLCSVLTARDSCLHFTSPEHEKFSRSKDNTVMGFAEAHPVSSLSLESKSSCRIQGANASRTCLTHVRTLGAAPLCARFGVTLPWAFQWIFSSAVEDDRNLGGICLSSPSVLAKTTRFLE